MQSDQLTSRAAADQPAAARGRICRRFARPLLTVALLLCIGIPAGCNLIGAIAYKVGGQDDVPAEYTLLQKPTVVLVENFAHRDLMASDAELLAINLQADLRTNKLVPVVPTEKIIDLRSRDPGGFAKMSIPPIGRAVAAEQVLYVHLQSGGVSSLGGGSVLQGRASALVRVVDANTGETLWPITVSDGWPVTFETDPLGGTDRFTPDDVRQSLYTGLADKIGKLFRKWKPGTESKDPRGPNYTPDN